MYLPVRTQEELPLGILAILEGVPPLIEVL